MANTADTLKAGNVIEVTYSGTGDDWNHKDDGGFNHPIKVKSIIWYPTANNDKLVINEGGNDGPSIVQWEASADNDTKQINFANGMWMKPYIDLTDCTFGTVTSTKIIFHIA